MDFRPALPPGHTTFQDYDQTRYGITRGDLPLFMKHSREGDKDASFQIAKFFIQQLNQVLVEKAELRERDPYNYTYGMGSLVMEEMGLEKSIPEYFELAHKQGHVGAKAALDEWRARPR